jgi:nucleotide-binding universal stress UspA family protein
MPHEIIIGFDESEQSRDAVALGCALADAIHAKVVLAKVYFHDRFYDTYTYGDFEREAKAEAAELLRQAVELVGDRAVETIVIGASTTTRGLHDLAIARDATMIVVGSTRRSAIGRAIPGTTARHLLSGGPCAVAVAPRGTANAAPRIDKIGVAFNGSPESRHALRIAGEIAKSARATVRLIRAVMPTLPPVGAPYAITTANRTLSQEHEERAKKECSEAIETLPADCRDTIDVQVGDAVAVLRSHAHDVDLMVCGSRGYGRGRQVLLGSTSAGLVDHAECPVLVVPRAAEAAIDEQRLEQVSSSAQPMPAT